MTRLLVLSMAFFSAAAMQPATAAGDEASPREAIARALPTIVEGGRTWIEEKKCVSCHRVAFTTWALSSADRLGLEVDREQLDAWRRWSRDHLLSPPKEDAPPRGATNLEGVSQLLLSEQVPATSMLDDDARHALTALLVEKQREDGCWDAGGQLPGQKRPSAETVAVSTGWNALALATLDAPASEARAKAQTAIAVSADGASTEWYAVRLLLALAADATDEARGWADKLRALQHDDGGWGWLVQDPSDALATGQALYALASLNAPDDKLTIDRAVRFLVDTQNADGGWTVHGTKKKSRDEATETAGYWGTCWAVMGLARTLDAAPPSAP